MLALVSLEGHTEGMTQMSKAQRTAVLEAHTYRVANPNGLRDGHVDARGGKGRTARWRMIEAMMTAGHLDRAGRITRAGLVAAGVDMDALHAEASYEYSLWEMEQSAAEEATPAYRHFVKAVQLGGDYRAAMDVLHAEALVENGRRTVVALRRNPELADGTLGGVEMAQALVAHMIETDHAEALECGAACDGRASVTP